MQHSGRDGSAVGGESCRKLTTTLETVFSSAVYDNSALQDDVCGYVKELRKSGMSAQNVILAAKNLVKETAVRFPPYERMDTLLTRMLGWCLDEYYRESA